MMWFERLGALLQNRFGLYPDREERNALQSLVRRRCRALDLDGDDYVGRLLRASVSDPEVAWIIDAVTTGHTFFFRDLPQLRAIVTALRQQRSPRRQRIMNVWCAGCSSGEEPYSIALLCEREGLRVQIVGSDIHSGRLEQAREGRYSSWSLRLVPEVLRERFFLRERDEYRVRPLLKERLLWRHHNLTQEPPLRAPGGDWDLIVCRNVLIYYPEDRTRKVIQSFVSVCGEHGKIFVGAAESLARINLDLQIESIDGQTFYQYGSVRSALLSKPLAGSASSPSRLLLSPSAPSKPLLSSLEQLEETPPPAPPEDLTAALAALKKGDIDAATSLLEAITSRDPHHTRAWLVLGHASLFGHDFERALIAYRQAQLCSASWPEVHYFQGLVYRKTGEIEHARGAFTDALSLQPTFWPASCMLAGIYQRTRQHDARKQAVAQTLEALETHDARDLFRSPLSEDPRLCPPREDVRLALAPGADVLVL